MADINILIAELVRYAVKSGLTDERDTFYLINGLLDIFDSDEYKEVDEETLANLPERELHLILEDMLEILGAETNAQKDLLDTRIMGILTPPPSTVIDKFESLRRDDAKAATDWYYSFSQATNYIRTDRIAKDLKWKSQTDFGEMDITINLSKPEKDPRDIAAAGKARSTSYPKCLLCPANEGYRGTVTHPARQNHRIIPITLDGEEYFLQYSPYVYYNEHCIILNKKHIPMVINRSTFVKLLSFVGQFPHYTAGSNADLPIVGGSILSHDHFQGGCYVFPMERARYEHIFTVPGYEDVTAGIVKWPMSLIRLTGSSVERISDLADHILTAWRSYTDESAFIYAFTDDTPHNTITPIARTNSDGLYELDLVLRNNITTEEHPLGVYHPHAEYHHLKKENIGLIEVMGLAILPARLKNELAIMEDAILDGRDLSSIPEVSSHAPWAQGIISSLPSNVTREKLHRTLEQEIGKAFSEILECAGVFKRTPEGLEAFRRFIATL